MAQADAVAEAVLSSVRLNSWAGFCHLLSNYYIAHL